MRYLQKIFLIASILITVSGCQTYYGAVEEKDSYPDEPLSVDHIPDAVPTVEPISAAGNKTPYKVRGKTYHLIKSPENYEQTGFASWYGRKFHGDRTSNGEIYDMFGMTAAHKTLPIPSYVRVTNIENNRSVIVRVNDRGPFHRDRIIDLTYTAAKKLGFVEQGTAKVNITYIDPKSYQATLNRQAPVKTKKSTLEKLAPTPKNSGGYALPENTYLQVGAFSSLSRADALKAELRDITRYPIDVLFPGINESRSRSPLFKVQVGPFDNNAELQRLRQALLHKNYPPPHVVYRADKRQYDR